MPLVYNTGFEKEVQEPTSSMTHSSRRPRKGSMRRGVPNREDLERGQHPQPASRAFIPRRHEPYWTLSWDQR